ncbi:hypothetical protein QIA31_06030 (plasmid) [Borreliella turdi]|uniref:hypothetical protein n=1 Tax=Borreliella turdi TaxID=57863 RepID=UPI003AF1A410
MKLKSGLFIFFISFSLFAFDNDIGKYIEKIEEIHTNYYSVELRGAVYNYAKILISSLSKIENNILSKYDRSSFKFNYLNLLISLVFCDIAYLIDDVNEYKNLINRVLLTYKHSIKASFNFLHEFSDYFRALGELALNLITHDSSNSYFYIVNGKRFLDKALIMDNQNYKVNLPLAMFYTSGVTNKTFSRNLFALYYFNRAEEVFMNKRQRYLKEIAKSSFFIRINRRVEAIDCLKSACKIFPNGYLTEIAFEKLKKGLPFF